MSIFNNDKTHNLNAYLNWMVDDGNGRLDNPIEQQRAWNHKTFGKSYLNNAEISLATMIAEGNTHNEIDADIFPVLFNIWHGIELLLKSGNTLCDMLLGVNPQNYTTHKIDVYADLLKANMKKLGFRKVETTHLSEMLSFVQECKDLNANFDFARYTETSKGEQQFYNTPDEKGFLQNHRVDVIELYLTIKEMNKKFPDCIDYLFDYYTAYKTNLAGLNDADLQSYTKIGLEFDENYPEMITTYKDILTSYVDEKIAEYYPDYVKNNPQQPAKPKTENPQPQQNEKE